MTQDEISSSMTQRKWRLRRRRIVPMIKRVRSSNRTLARVWRQSLQLRVVTSTMVLSIVVLMVLGFVLTQRITSQLLDVKIHSALEETNNARQSVERALTSADSTNVQAQLSAARNSLGGADDQAQTTTGGFETVLIAPSATGATVSRPGQPDSELAVGDTSLIPSSLRSFVQAKSVSYQYKTLDLHDGRGNRKTIIFGTPVNGPIRDLQLYLIFPLDNDESTVRLVRNTLFAGSVVLIVLLAAIALLVSRQVVMPVRSASRIAVRFAEGRLRERMPVRGEDEMARLAMSFNEMAESLSKQITQLEEFGNLQRQFTSDVSHELRTPLTTVRMAADVLHAGSDELNPMMKRSSELLVEELDRFELLLTELLEISRHDAGVAELSTEQINVEVPINAAVDMVRNLAQRTGTDLVLDLPTEPVIAEVDSRRVERILRNLLANAVDHGEGKPVTLTLRRDDRCVAITVRDRGIGLKPGEEKLVFNRFWRSDKSRVRQSGGTGLGLAMSLEDARLHSGRLEAWGAPGYGAQFRLTLPLREGMKVQASPLPLKPADVPKTEGRS